jgi:long-chain acyl-CoA synthetase
VISGGATLPSELEEFWTGAGFALIQGYGMTETSALVTLNHPFRIGHGTIGKPLPGREVRLSDDGEILVRGDVLAGATWQNGAMRAREGEWLATGDLAERNEQGELRFTGRKGDVIVTTAGMNVHPVDLEDALMKQPKVRGCVVVACQIGSVTEPVAVVLYSGSDEDLNAAVAAANGGLAEYQKIRRILRWSELQFPFTSTGKLLRRKVAEWACIKVSTGRVLGESARQDELPAMIAEITGERIAGGDELRLSEDMHLDSLGRVQLQSILEQRLGIEVDDDAIATVTTLGELRAMLVRGTGLAVVANGIVAPAKSQHAETEEIDTRHSYPRWPWSWPMRMIRIAFLEAVMRPLIWMLAAPRVVRETNDVPDRPVLIISNHVTAYDGALVLYALPAKLRRRVAIAMSAETLMAFRKGRDLGNSLRNFFGPPAYWLVVALFNVFPLPRLRGFRRSFAHAGEAMDRGDSVIIFPEGTRSRDGLMHSFRPGTGMLAEESGVPVVPVALIGLHEMRAAKRWVRTGKLEIHVGRAISVDEGVSAAELTLKFEDSVRALLAEEQSQLR